MDRLHTRRVLRREASEDRGAIAVESRERLEVGLDMSAGSFWVMKPRSLTWIPAPPLESLPGRCGQRPTKADDDWSIPAIVRT